jgi:hypothetical protein
MVHLPVLRTWLVLLATGLAAGCGGGPSGPGDPVIGPGDPVIVSGAPTSGATGIVYPGYAFTVASGGLAPFAWTETGALPPGLSLSTTGMLTGTPTHAGSYTIAVMVADSSNPALTGTLPVTLKIDDTPIVVSTTAPPAGVVSNSYNGVYNGFVFYVWSGGSPPFTWSITSGALPPGLMLTSTGSLSGTPTTAGPFTFTVTATDSAQPALSGSQSFPLTVNVPAPLSLNATPVPTPGVHGTPYLFNISATGGYLPLTFALAAGSGPVPPGLTLGVGGSLSGTPTTIGPYTFSVTVTDSAPGKAAISTLPFTMVITNPPPPSITSGPPPTATEGMAYSFAFAAKQGLAPFAWTENDSKGLGGLTLGLAGLLAGTPTSYGIFPISVTVMDAVGQSSPATPVMVRISRARAAPTFTATGSLNVARAGHTATLLSNGKVLVAGGPDSSAELYDPSTGKFTTIGGSMTEARKNHAAVLLSDGKVLIVGPTDATAELYDPAIGMFAATGSMTTPRTQPVATLLNSGKVLVVGGNAAAADLSAELYDPVTGRFTATGSMTTPRTNPTATLLSNGSVLVAGGAGTSHIMSAELYDPAAGTFSATGSMTVARTNHAAIRLQDGTVLIVGTEATADVYDPVSGTFTAVGNPLQPAFGYTLSLRSDGSALVTGGFTAQSLYTRRVFFGHAYCGRLPFPISSATVEWFAPESEGFTRAGDAVSSRDGGHTATMLGDGSILVVGGTQHSVGNTTSLHCTTPATNATILSSAELIK